MDYRRNLSKSVCEELLGANRDKRYTSKVVPSIRATIVDQYDGNIHIRYQATDVVIFKADGTIVLNSGGWRTTTTKSRMNAALNGTGWRVWQDDWQWYVGKVDENVRYTFSDSMEVYGE